MCVGEVSWIHKYDIHTVTHTSEVCAAAATSGCVQGVMQAGACQLPKAFAQALELGCIGPWGAVDTICWAGNKHTGSHPGLFSC